MWMQLATLITDDISGESPPTEFRIFKAGRNDTLEGPYFFTESSAQSVVQKRADWGVDCMVDLEHLSLKDTDSPSTHYDPDARAWCSVEVRNGELWATNVRWTPDGETRLRNKTQKYISPAFTYNSAGEITGLFNLALVAMPKTKQAPALANADFNGKKSMDIDQLVSVAKALGVKTVEELTSALAGLIGLGKPEKPEVEEPEAPTAPAMAAAAPPPAPAEDPEKMAQNSASFRNLSAENATLKTQLATLNARLGVIESAERKALVGELVKLGAETPATAWADESANTPCERLSNESIDSLKNRVAQLSANAKSADSISAPTSDSLSEQEQKICKETGCDPVVFAKIKASRSKR